jgi:hypothetical protein
VCRHVEKARIELLIAGGASHRSVGAKFGLSHYSIGRHWKHTPEERKVALAIGPVKQAALAARACEESESVLDGLKAVRAGLWQVYCNAVEASDKTGTALLAGRLNENYNSIARLTGQIMSSPMIQNNTIINNNSLSVRENAEYEALQARILHVLESHPDALRAVIAELERANNQALPALEHHAQEETAHAST